MAIAPQNRQRLKIAAITSASVLLAWLVLPTMLGGTPLVRAPLESYLSRQLHARVDINGLAVSTLGFAPDISISSLDVYDATSNQFIVYCDHVAVRLSFWHLLVGHVKTTHGSIERLDMVLPTLLLQRFLLQQGYLSRPLLIEPENGVDQHLSLQDSSFSLVSSGRGWRVQGGGRYDTPLFRNGRFELDLLVEPPLRRITVNRATIHGTCTTEKHVRSGRDVQMLDLSSPLTVEVSGVADATGFSFPRILCSLGSLTAVAKVQQSATNFTLNIDLATQSLDRVACVIPSLDIDSTLSNIDAHIASTRDPATGQLKTEGAMRIAGGRLGGVPFSDGSLTIKLENDRVVSLSALANAWDGFARATLMEGSASVPERGGAAVHVLLGQIAARGVDLNACLSSFVSVPARSGGEVSFDFTFDMENMGVGEFLSRELHEFDFVNGQGSLALSNAYLQFFATEQWLESPATPKVVRSVLALAANLTGSANAVPVLTKIVKDIDLTTPRSVTAKLVVHNGTVSTPEVTAVTPLGTLRATGTCDAVGALQYRIQIRLSKELEDKYGDHPVIALFKKGDVLMVPVKLVGTLSQPRVELDLTDQERDALENTLMQVLEEMVRQKLSTTVGISTDEGAMLKEKQRIEEMVRALIRKLF